MDDPSIAELDAELWDRLVSFKPKLDSFKIREAHFPGDMTLAGIGTIVWEAANALLLVVRDGKYMAGAHPVARLVLEAGMEALFIASSTDYDSVGARARVFEALEYVDQRLNLGAAYNIPEFQDEEAEYARIQELIRREADTLNSAAAGRGNELLSSLEDLLPKFRAARQGKRHPGHWSGLSRRRMAQELEKRAKDDAVKGRLVAAYSALSRSSHPGFLSEMWDRSAAESGPVLVARPGRARIPLWMASVGVGFAITALDQPGVET